MIPKGNPNPTGGRDKDDLPGYPSYGAEEDIYNNAKEEKSIDPEMPDSKQTSALPEQEIAAGEFIEGSENQPGSQEFPPVDDGEDDLDLDDDDDDLDDLDDDDDLDLDGPALSRGKRAGEELDVPGAELDDDMEELGSEDEENNYYSLGGDNHER